jgi:L,D-peptidoglycan transpeptidase YkuD (ErfK/YbiS/YcfS/YnhG family)
MSPLVRVALASVTLTALMVVVTPVEQAAHAAVADVGTRSCSTPAPALGAVPPNARQVVTVEAATASSTTAAVSLWSRTGSCVVRVGGPWTSSVGRSGVSSHKVEGDGTTPSGTYSIGPVMYGIAPDPGVAYRYHRIVCGDWWDEAPSSPGYNHFVHVRCGTAPPFGGDSEALWQVVPQYDYFAVIDYNISPIVPGRGSAIFLHESTGVPTAGCVALGAPALLVLLRWLRPSRHPVVVISNESRAS